MRYAASPTGSGTLSAACSRRSEGAPPRRPAARVATSAGSSARPGCGSRGGVLGLRAQHPEQPAHVGQRRPGRGRRWWPARPGRARSARPPGTAPSPPAPRSSTCGAPPRRASPGRSGRVPPGSPGGPVPARCSSACSASCRRLRRRRDSTSPSSAIATSSTATPERVGLVGVEEAGTTMLNAAAQAVTAESSVSATMSSTTRKPMICTGAHGQDSFGLGVRSRRGTASGRRSARPPAGAGPRRRPAAPRRPTAAPDQPASRARGCPAGTRCWRRPARSAPGCRAARRTGKSARGPARSTRRLGPRISRRSGPTASRAIAGPLVSIPSRLRRRCRRVVPPRCRPAPPTRVLRARRFRWPARCW